MKRVNYGGSALNFVLMAGLLAVLLVVGVYIVRQLTIQRVSIQQPTTSTNSTHTQQKSTTFNSRAPASIPNQTSESSNHKVVVAPIGDASFTTLPHTGPVQTVSTVIIVGILSWSVAAYIHSRRFVVSF
jgi:hypothetical protein